MGIAHSQNGSKNRIIIREKTTDSRSSHNKQPAVIITRVERHQQTVRKDALQRSQSKKQAQNYSFKQPGTRLVSAKSRKLSSPRKKLNWGRL